MGDDEIDVGPIRLRDSRGRHPIVVGTAGGGLVRRDAGSRCRFFATDSGVKFKRLGARFLGTPLNEVELVDLGG